MCDISFSDQGDSHRDGCVTSRPHPEPAFVPAWTSVVTPAAPSHRVRDDGAHAARRAEAGPPPTRAEEGAHGGNMVSPVRASEAKRSYAGRSIACEYSCRCIGRPSPSTCAELR